MLLSSEVGEGLFFAGNNHVALRVVASPDEHKLVTSKPSEILQAQHAAQAAQPQPQPAPTAAPVPSPTPNPNPKVRLVTDTQGA